MAFQWGMTTVTMGATMGVAMTATLRHPRSSTSDSSPSNGGSSRRLSSEQLHHRCSHEEYHRCVAVA